MPAVSSVANLASGHELLSPGVLAVISGQNLGLAQPSTVPVSIVVNGAAAAVLDWSPERVRAQLPVELQAGPAMLEAERQGIRSVPYPITLQAFAPGLFTTDDGFATAWTVDNRPVAPASPAEPGEEIWILATGLGPTEPPMATGEVAPASPPVVTTTLPTVTVGGQQAVVREASLQPFNFGRFRVFFRVPEVLSKGQHPLVLHIAGFTSNAVILPIVSQGIPTIASIVSSANFGFEGVASPGSILSLFGLNFGVDDDLNLFPATEFQGLSLTFDGTDGPLFAVSTSRGQINVYAPTELPEFGLVTVRLRTPNGTSESFDLQMAPATPAFFRLTDPGGIVLQSAAAQLANTAWLAIPSSFAERLLIPKDCSENGLNAASVCGQPAKPGDVIQVFVTGLGKATVNGEPGGQILPTGQTAPRDGSALYQTIEVSEVTVDGIPAEVLFSGLAPGFAGLYQLNIRIPVGVSPGDEVEITIRTSNGLTDTATIAIMAR